MSDRKPSQDMSAPPSDRRQSPRASVSLQVEYQKLNAFFSDYTKNISHGGLFVATEDPLPVGTVFELRLLIPKLPVSMALCGEVMWQKRKGAPSPEGIPEDHEEGMGIRFLYDSKEQRAAITETVEQLMKESLGTHLTQKLMGHRP